MLTLVDKAERFLLRIVRRVLPDSNNHINVVSGIELNDAIRSALTSGRPFMACRFGSTEFENFSYAYAMRLPLVKRYRMFIEKKIDVIHRSDRCDSYYIDRLCTFSGFFPNDPLLLSRYTDAVLFDMNMIDVLGVWQKEALFWPKLSHCLFGKMEDLEPYDYDNPWSSALEGKKVLVVHPFAASICQQYINRQSIWPEKNVLPDFDIKTIKAVQSIAGEKAPFSDWFQALDYMKVQMDAVEYDVAIIGCGAYGFHLAAHAKRTGHQAIHLGGATQILFGIKGKRWDSIPDVSKFYNDSWVYPLPEETPKNSARVEGGCYW